MRAKEAAQPVAAIAADEPSEAGSAASELANDAERPYRIVEHAQRASAAPEHRPPKARAVRRCGLTMPHCGTLAALAD